jgi:hypothetical protein
MHTTIVPPLGAQQPGRTVGLVTQIIACPPTSSGTVGSA